MINKKNFLTQTSAKEAKMITLISLALVLFGAINWLAIGAMQYDIIAGFFGSQASIMSRIIYFIVGAAAFWIIFMAIKYKGKIKINEDGITGRKRRDVLAAEKPRKAEPAKDYAETRNTESERDYVEKRNMQSENYIERRNNTESERDFAERNSDQHQNSHYERPERSLDNLNTPHDDYRERY